MSSSRNRWVSFGDPPIAEPTAPADEPQSTAPTGATRPQLSVPQPDHADRLPRWNVTVKAPDYWLLGVHGGAGETTLARLDRRTRAAGHHWPLTAPGSTVVLVARSNISGLRAAQLAATEWASGTVPGIRVAGLAILADAPGRLPKEIREFAQIVGGGVPHLWHFPWIEAWRLGHDVPPEELPKEARTVLEQVRIAATTTASLPTN
ncbi:hypothetical protein OIT41_20820 (plasmid) [Arthrobacter sp. YA7-1]|uniref:DUF6668 family protein n=1 Tax=Arthrobacter sp. YA7-1 TaxID=2987701 RepID=UPI002227A888|nr:DUF6668 family protein [Arthrobacter sp. YA7-1]UYY83707.1 hypothetical protein OIT41_20820 [Arthrobacter sp. YA7-1]